MSRESRDEVAEVARRRLEVLAPGPPAVEVVARPIRLPGRHRRDAGAAAPGAIRAWLGDRMPDALHGRMALRTPHLAVLGAVVVLAVLATAMLVWRSRPVPVPAGSASPAGPLVSMSPTTTAHPAATPGAVVVVDVAGKVRRPGVTSLPAGSRVVDAIERAGGARKGVDLSTINLARVLVDGEQILVGVPAAGGAAAAAADNGPGGGALVNLNSAGADLLEGLPGVGPVTAQRILSWRAEHGRFTAVDELLEVDGIGEKTLADIAPHVTL